MTLVDDVLARVPRPLRLLLLRYRELLKFGFVGGTAFLVDNGIWYALKLTILTEKPTTAKGIGILVATIVSYVLNREWSFRTRGGRERHHEAALYFLISGIAIVINLIPLLISRYVLNLEVPHVSLLVQEVADFTSASIIGLVLAMAFRFWGYKRWVFPDEFGDHRTGVPV
ncbi:GtrA family protein [Haloechinothrix sp. LS1_15]|uniref:GtrA family protein n=1 Tax=Haloechinothrix sp. LS1_15 TaxID=2652248 RepID=UPI0029479176|nr:GtrA family protein [Haloechinothrix sp. LS1_15]MDV6012937.1 GtrA family protein [Haloechinothrix sp. LS1_15]